MLALSVVFGDGPACAWRFMFKEALAAQQAQEAISSAMEKNEIARVKDDLGQSAIFRGDAVKGVNLEDGENPEMKKFVDQQRRSQFNRSGIAVAPGPQPPGFMS